MRVIYRDKEWELKGGMAARDAILKVGLNPEAVLVVRDDELITDDTILDDNDIIKLIAVISGGMPSPTPNPLPLPTLRLRSGQVLGEGGGQGEGEGRG